ncbi:MAG: ring-cleaving dioxygenase [Balneolaceae bacterium]|nr:ring-cleaving dioxygenase [Balneolaceae bacterium]
MATQINGLHHITAVSGPPELNYDFYTRKLGLRFVKKTINFDDPFTYHLYYGNYEATPGSAITFFPWQGVPQGSPSTGEATVTSYAVPKGSFDFWRDRFKRHKMDLISEESRFGEHLILFKDVEGMKNELVETVVSDSVRPHNTEDIPENAAIRGFYGTTLSLADTGRTAELLREFGWKEKAAEGDVVRYTSEPENQLGTTVDLKYEPGMRGRFGRGSIHHIAFRVPDDKAQEEWRKKLTEMGFGPTEVRDRQYFRSIYFREPGGVLFEIATDTPGFTKDEPLESLGQELKLPPWFEKNRTEIEKRLPEL